MLLNELFDNPVEWKYYNVSESGAAAAFVIGDNRYIVTINEYDYTVYNIIFEIANVNDQTKYDSHGITNTGNQYAVFSTVKDILKDFMSKHKTLALVFTAKEKSRASLYAKMVPLFKSVGLPESSTIDNEGIITFVVAEDEGMLEDVMRAIKNLHDI